MIVVPTVSGPSAQLGAAVPRAGSAKKTHGNAIRARNRRSRILTSIPPRQQISVALGAFHAKAARNEPTLARLSQPALRPATRLLRDGERRSTGCRGNAGTAWTLAILYFDA